MLLRKRFVFQDLLRWDDQLNAAIEVFRRQYLCWPNIMCACSELWARIDLIAGRSPGNIEDAEGNHPSGSGYVAISSFLTGPCEVVFTVNESIPAPEYLLVYDDDPRIEEQEVSVGDGGITVRPYALAGVA